MGLKLTSLFVARFVTNLFVFNDLAGYCLSVALLAFLTGDHGAWSRRTDIWEGSASFATHRSIAVLVVLVGLLGGTLYAVNWKPFVAARELALAASASDVERQLEHYRRVLQLKSLATREAREALIATATSRASRSRTVQHRRLVEFAREEIVAHPAEWRMEARDSYLAGRFLLAIGDVGAAKEYLERAAALSPRMQVVSLGLAWAYLEEGDMTGALELAEEAFEMNEGAVEVRFEYALVAVHCGRFDLAHGLLGIQAPIKGTRLLDDRLVHAYYVTNRPDALAALWAEHAAAKPKFRTRLRLYYAELR